jgi:hypothetical protein
MFEQFRIGRRVRARISGQAVSRSGGGFIPFSSDLGPVTVRNQGNEIFNGSKITCVSGDVSVER